MQSKNKRPPTAQERGHIARVAALSCVVCDAPGPSQVHEPEQGLWFASIALCPPCHTGPKGWHGTRERWKLARVSEVQAINRTVQAVYGWGVAA